MSYARNIHQDLRRLEASEYNITAVSNAKSIVDHRTEIEDAANKDSSNEIEGASAYRPRGGCPFAALDGQLPSDHPHIPADESTTHYSYRGQVKAIHWAKKRTKRASFNDPLETTAHIDAPPAPPSEVASSASGPACPIRFLDQHSPEEIAKYFEEHKHELPRSHEVCVKRFQANADSIRELDAKYGNLVTMIQGLGQKHQPMLHTNPDSEPAPAGGHASRSQNKIRDWASAVSDQAVAEDDAGQDRRGHFDRPLKDIRVGESPSRPWGVPIPSKYLDAAEEGTSLPEAQTRPVTKEEPHYSRGTEAGAPPAPVAKKDVARHDTTAQEEGLHPPVSPQKRRMIINHGRAFISSSQAIGSDYELYNHGTLMLGFDFNYSGVRDLIGQIEQMDRPAAT